MQELESRSWEGAYPRRASVDRSGRSRLSGSRGRAQIQR
jgi:hypothetical protein